MSDRSQCMCSPFDDCPFIPEDWNQRKHVVVAEGRCIPITVYPTPPMKDHTWTWYEKQAEDISSCDAPKGHVSLKAKNSQSGENSVPGADPIALTGRTRG